MWGYSMICRVYDPQLNKLGQIETFVSLVWTEKYNQLGTFQLELSQQQEYSDLMKEDYYCEIDDSDTLMIIKSVQTEGNKIIVNGAPATRLLSDRVSTAELSNINAETAMRTLIHDMQAWPCVALGASCGLADKFEAQTSDQTIEEYCEKIAQAVDAGFRLRFDKPNRKLLFEVYKPGESQTVKFSTWFQNVGNLDYCVSTASYKNVAIVAGAGTGDERITVYAGDTASAGIDRREMYVDARQEQQKNDESLEDYKARLVEYGKGKLLEQLRLETLDFDIDSDCVNLGDVVSCIFPELGINAKVRIMGKTITAQNNVTQYSVELGTPVITKRY
jgi:hypothetical protein